jgi:hypothetical protein
MSAGLEAGSPSPSNDASLVRALHHRAPGAVVAHAGQPAAGAPVAAGGPLDQAASRPAQELPRSGLVQPASLDAGKLASADASPRAVVVASLAGTLNRAGDYVYVYDGSYDVNSSMAKIESSAGAIWLRYYRNPHGHGTWAKRNFNWHEGAYHSVHGGHRTDYIEATWSHLWTF